MIIVEDIKKFQFKGDYECIKLRVMICKNLVKQFEEERDIYHLNIWKENLTKVKHTLKCYDQFISLFPEVMSITEFEKEIDRRVKVAMSDKNTEIKYNG